MVRTIARHGENLRGVKLPTGISLQDIATAVGVSVSTVSRALNDSERVSLVTKQAVQNAIEEIARQRERGDGRATIRPMIGITHSHPSGIEATRGLDVILEQVLAGVEIECLRAGYIPYPWQQSRLLGLPDGEPFFQAVSGVIMSGGLVGRDLLEQIRSRDLPVVIIGGHVSGLDVPSVGADNQRGTYCLTRHLIDLGHRRIALVNGPSETYTSFEKKAGYLTALVEAGVDVDPALIRWQDGFAGFDAPAAVRRTEELLALANPPTAVLYASDTMAEAGYRVLGRAGRRIPEDVSVAGFHDDRNACHLDPPLTTVRVDRIAWGKAAAIQLFAMLAGRRLGGTRTLLPVELVIRKSTGPVPERKGR